MKKSCFAFLAAFLCLATTYVLIVKIFVPWGPALVLGILGSLSVIMLFGGVLQCFQNLRKIFAVRRALSGSAFRDGGIAAAIGRISASAAPLKSPIQQKDVVLYEYDVYRVSNDPNQQNRSSGRDILYSGMAMTPASIQTMQGSVRLMGLPTLDHLLEITSMEDNATMSFLDYLGSNSFEVALGMKKLSAVGKLADMFEENDGACRQDLQLGKAPVQWDEFKVANKPSEAWAAARNGGDIPSSWHNLRFSEKIVAVGEEVVAFGRYDATQMALFNQMGFGGSVNDLYPGKPDAVIRKLRNSGLSMLVFAIVFFSFLHLILALMITRAPRG